MTRFVTVDKAVKASNALTMLSGSILNMDPLISMTNHCSKE